MSKFIYWFLQFTWGFPLNVAGGILAFVLICKGKMPQKFGHAIYFEVGENWGGLNLGAFFFVQENASTHIKRHEYGHGFQNIMLGVLTPFLITLPSAIRYHYRNYKRGQGCSLPPYDSFWCEGWATRLGEKFHKGKGS